MSKKINKKTAELSDSELDAVAGGALINDKEIPNWYVSCELSGDIAFCSCICQLNGTPDCIEGFCNPSAAKTDGQWW